MNPGVFLKYSQMAIEPLQNKDKQLHIDIVGWNYLSIPDFQRSFRWSLGMDKGFHPILCLSMLGLKLTHISERGPRCLPMSASITYTHMIAPLPAK